MYRHILFSKAPLLLLFWLIAVPQWAEGFVFPGWSVGGFPHRAFCNTQCLKESHFVVFIPCTALKALHRSVCLYSRQYGSMHTTGGGTLILYHMNWMFSSTFLLVKNWLITLKVRCLSDILISWERGMISLPSRSFSVQDFSNSCFHVADTLLWFIQVWSN